MEILKIDKFIKLFIEETYNTHTNDKYITYDFYSQYNCVCGSFSNNDYEIIFKKSKYEQWIIEKRKQKIKKLQNRIDNNKNLYSFDKLKI